MRAFLRAPSGIFGLVAILAMTAVALVTPHFLTDAATVVDMTPASRNQPPSWEHAFGTDGLGRDLLARMFVATRLSLGMGVLAELVAFGVGVPCGAVVALLGAPLRTALMRVIDTMIAFPGLLVTIFLLTILGPALGLLGIAVGIAIPSAFRLARIVSTLSLSIGGRDYLGAARALGVRPPRLLMRYILPNIAETLLISLALGVSGSVLSLAGLSFLGLGVQPPEFDWGQLLTQGVNAFYLTPVAALGPMLFIAVTAAAFAFLGEALARASNPLVWTQVGSARLGATPGERGLAVPGRGRTPGRGAIVADMAEERNIAPVLEVRDLNVRFPGPAGAIQILSDVSFSLGPGERLGLVGESGSGKTTTALAIAKLTPHPGRTTGEVTLLGRQLQTLSDAALAEFLGTELAFVFQDPSSSLNPALTVGRQLTEGAEEHRHLTHGAAVAAAIDRLREVNLPTPERQMERRPHELSGGMRQRVMIAMGLMNEPKLLICDEPTTALDVTIQAQIMDVLARINAEHGTAIILIAHNLALVRQNCDRVIVMYAGRIVEDLASDDLLTDPLHPYTRALLEAVPDIARGRGEDLATIPGQTPDPSSLPSGCAFHPRCKLAEDRCRIERPPLLARDGGRRVACWVANAGAAEQ